MVPIPRIVFVIAFIKTKQSKTEGKPASLVRYTLVGHAALYSAGCAVTTVWGRAQCGDVWLHSLWLLLLSFTSLFISFSVSGSLSFSTSSFFSSLLRGPYFPLWLVTCMYACEKQRTSMRWLRVKIWYIYQSFLTSSALHQAVAKICSTQFHILGECVVGLGLGGDDSNLKIKIILFHVS